MPRVGRASGHPWDARTHQCANGAEAEAAAPLRHLELS